MNSLPHYCVDVKVKVCVKNVQAVHKYYEVRSTYSKSCRTQKDCSSERFDWFPTLGPAVDHKQSLLLCENLFLWGGGVYEIFHDLLDRNFLITSSQAYELLGFMTIYSCSETFVLTNCSRCRLTGFTRSAVFSQTEHSGLKKWNACSLSLAPWHTLTNLTLHTVHCDPHN